MVLLALAFIGLASFIGLAVDTGILFIQIGHLRRAADAASLAAANQFREGRTTAQIEAAADEFINLNSLNPANANIFICDFSDPTSIYHDPALCPAAGDPPRKFVRVEASMPVEFAFLPVIGFGSININANAVSETASVDLVLAIDTSPSMAYDAACDDGDDDDAWAETNLPGGLGAPDGVADDCGGAQVGGFEDDYFRDPNNCNLVFNPNTGSNERHCHPFEEVRAAALALVSRMYFPYDRMAIITFDVNAITQLNLSTSQSNVVNQINAIEVAASPPCPGFPDPRGCTSTNIADGLEASGNQFGMFQREEAVWIVILLTDGGANAATDSGGNWICPGAPNAPTWMSPFCRDPDFEIGTGAYGYDAEDAAEDAALFVGCPDSNSPQPAACPAAGQGAVIFSIGLGDLVVDNRNCDPAAYPPGYPTGCAPEAGEDLLRYIAGVGDDGDPATPSAIDPCFGEASAQSCGNYYFSPTGSGLLRVFEAIASRIFTRITH